MADQEDAAFDKIMELVGNDGKFQKIFNYFFIVGLMCFSSMNIMNIVTILSKPDHTCLVPGRENYNKTIDEWRNLTIPFEKDNRDILGVSACKMYNISAVEHLPVDQWNFKQNDTISCAHGYDYDKTWYERTVVSDQDWICDDAILEANVLTFHRIGEVVGTFFFGQLGDTIGRRPVFYYSAILLLVGRVATIFSASVYVLFAAVSILSTLTNTSIFTCPLIIAMETSKDEDRGKIAMLQCVGWTIGLILMPMVFWLVRDWTYLLWITSLPIVIFAMWPKYMIESPRWLATKRYLDRCAVELNRIAKINGKNVIVTEKLLKEMLPDVQVEEVYGIASLFTGWRLTKNMILLTICYSITNLNYYVLIFNSTSMGGNPFLTFAYQSMIELPAYIIGRWLCDRIGRRFTNILSFLGSSIFCVPAVLFARQIGFESALLIVVVAVKFFVSMCYYTVYLQSMEIYPTCLRQSGIAVITISSNLFAMLSSYIKLLGTEHDARFPYAIIGALCLIGFSASLFLPETLHQKLPNTLYEAKKFGKEQKFWVLPKKTKNKKEEEIESLALQKSKNKIKKVDEETAKINN